MIKLHIILGSTRENREGEKVAHWVHRQAQANTAFDAELIDLRDWKLPMFQEHLGTIGNPADPSYSLPLMKQWNDKIKEADAFIFVTAEYNHSIPGELKNALDSVFFSFGLRNKPVAAVSYAGGAVGGARAIEHLAMIVIEMEAAPLRNSVIIPFVKEAFYEDGSPKDPGTRVALDVQLADLQWWANALIPARKDSLIPGQFRMRAGLAAAAKAAETAAPSDSVADDVAPDEREESAMSAVGTWTVTIQSPMGEQEGTLVLNEDGTGGLETMIGQVEVSEFVCEGNEFRYTASMGPITMNFVGVVDGDTFSGTSTSPMGESPVTGVRAS